MARRQQHNGKFETYQHNIFDFCESSIKEPTYLKVLLMRIEFYKEGKLHVTRSIRSWDHFESVSSELDEGRYKMVVYHRDNTIVRSMSIEDKKVSIKSRYEPIRKMIETSLKEKARA